MVPSLAGVRERVINVVREHPGRACGKHTGYVLDALQHNAVPWFRFCPRE